MYSVSAKVLQPGTPGTANHAQGGTLVPPTPVDIALESPNDPGLVTGQPGSGGVSTPADVAHQRAPLPKDRTTVEGGHIAHQPTAKHAVASLTALVQECFDAFKGGLYAITSELREREDRGVTDVEDAASCGLNAACGGLIAKLRRAAGDMTDLTVARTAMNVLNHSFQGGGVLVPNERDTRIAALEQAFDKLENLHQELLALYESLETKKTRLEQLQNHEVKLKGKPEPIPAHSAEGSMHGT
jgi:hypothetical protein